jgi:multiple sugar transport system substrate-binding protein
MNGGLRLIGRGGAVVVLAVTLAACGSSASNSTSSSGSASITYGRWGSADEISAGKVLLSNFHAATPTVKVNQQVADWDTYWTKLPTQMAAGQAPDAFLLDPGYYQVHYAGTGRLVNLDSLIAKNHVNMKVYWPQELPSFKYQGHYYELPRDISVNMLVWNRSLFAKAGLTRPPSSWQELVKDARLLTVDSAGHNATQAGFNPARTTQWGYASYEYLDGIDEPLITEMGGHLWSQPETGTHVKCLIDSPQGNEAINFLTGLIYKDHVSPNPTQLGHYQNIFASGKVAMYIDGTFDLPVYEAIHNFKWNLAPFPSWNGRTASMAQGVGNAINASSSNQHAAWQLVDWLSSAHGQKVMSSRGINIPSIRSMAVSQSFLKGKPSGMKSVIDSIKYGVPYLDFPHKADAFNYVDTLLTNSVFTGHMAVSAALKKAQDGANTILAGGHV